MKTWTPLVSTYLLYYQFQNCPVNSSQSWFEFTGCLDTHCRNVSIADLTWVFMQVVHDRILTQWNNVLKLTINACHLSRPFSNSPVRNFEVRMGLHYGGALLKATLECLVSEILEWLDDLKLSQGQSANPAKVTMFKGWIWKWQKYAILFISFKSNREY